jgi:iron complex transport system substrate-binding protein
VNDRLTLAGLLVAVAGAAVWVQAGTNASLIAPPERPDRREGNSSVRMEAAPYPRHATGADNVRTTIARPPQRIVSQFWSIDEYLYALVPPERVVGVSETAVLESSSNVLDFVTAFRPVIATNPETVLRANPDLVLAGEATRWEVSGLLRQAGVAVHRIHTKFETLASIEEHIRLIGYLTGEDERARLAVEDFHARISRASARRPVGVASPRVLGMGGSYSYGSKTLFNDIMRVLGAENISAAHGFVGYERVTDEHIARWDPDWIISGADRGQADVIRARLLARPAVAQTSAARNGRIVVITNDIFLPMSPFTPRLVERLADILYGEGSNAR